jgi:hypothetical protein
MMSLPHRLWLRLHLLLSTALLLGSACATVPQVSSEATQSAPIIILQDVPLKQIAIH